MSKAVPFGPYLLLEPIKDGGMSAIWRARPNGQSTVVAVKRVLRPYAKNPEMQALFLDEARVSVQLTHPNIAKVFDLGRVGDELYLAMEYVPGVDLSAIFKREAGLGSIMPVPLAVFALVRICDALDHAHRRVGARGAPLEIVHRDVAPDNCLVTFDGEVKLIDFGVAKAASQSEKTEKGALKGKLGYMSPEQVVGKALDRRSDLFSLGVVLYEMVTGQRLFWRQNPLETLRAVRTAAIAPPSRVNPQVPPALERVVLKALQRDPEQRYAWASEMGAALRTYLAGLRGAPTGAQLRKYLARTFPVELEAERTRRTEWARYGRETEAPTMMELAVVRAPVVRRPPPGVEVADGVDGVDGGDRPTTLPLRPRPGPDAVDEPLQAGAELPPPIPSPDRPTQALEAFAEGELDLEEQPTVPIEDTVPVKAARQRRPAPLEGTAPPAMMPRKPPRR